MKACASYRTLDNTQPQSNAAIQRLRNVQENNIIEDSEFKPNKKIILSCSSGSAITDSPEKYLRQSSNMILDTTNNSYRSKPGQILHGVSLTQSRQFEKPSKLKLNNARLELSLRQQTDTNEMLQAALNQSEQRRANAESKYLKMKSKTLDLESQLQRVEGEQSMLKMKAKQWKQTIDECQEKLTSLQIQNTQLL